MDDLSLWYDKPAPKWLAALPVGNGRMGAMVFGRVRKEWIQLNEETLWTRNRESRLNPHARENLPAIQGLLMEGKVREAQFLAENTMFGTPPSLTTYETLSNLVLLFADQYDEDARDYRRDLDLSTGIATVRFRIGTTTFTREIFASGPDEAVIIRLTADRPAALTFSTAFWRRYDNNYRSFPVADDLLSLTGQCGVQGVRYETLVKVVPEGGSTAATGDHIVITDADAVTLIVHCASDFRHADFGAVALAVVEKAAARPYDDLRADHVVDHRSRMDRFSLSINLSPEQLALRALPTDSRIQRMRSGGEDNGLVLTMAHYGRYLLQAASRPGTLPTTLQGIWNDTVAPAWDSKFTININEQMHYWPAETTNLADSHVALFDLIDRMRVHGAEVARVHYGARGFVAHHNTDIWADCAPLDNAFCGLWPLGAAWLVLHLWDHYQFAPDPDFLRDRVYPAMKDAAQFLIDLMFEDDQGRLMIGPTISPENALKGPAGERLALCLSPTMDVQITRALFSHLIVACEILEIDTDFADHLKTLLPKLPPTRIDSNGRIAEWLEDGDEYEPGHRHNSHLFGLYPDDQITPEATPELALAARRSLEWRIANGGAGPCWSRAWICGLWARLGDGAEMLTHLNAFIRESTDLNMFSMHPPQGSNPNYVFQLDGNLGFTAAVAEALLQSQAGRVKLLPALPAAWPTGRVTGLRARGGFEVSIEWHECKLVDATILSRSGLPLRIETSGMVITCDTQDVHARTENGETVINTIAGAVYRLRPDQSR